MAKVFKILVIFIVVSKMALTQVHSSQTEPSKPELPLMMNMTAGFVGIADSQDEPLRFGLEYRLQAFSQWQLIPALGWVFMENGAYFVYSDLRHEFWLTDHWALIPSFGLGFFKESKDLRLGNELEFRSGIEIAYRFYKKYRIGVALFHLSNGGIAEINPGTEVLVLSFSAP